jgi:thiamine kinase-like enzyme
MKEIQNEKPPQSQSEKAPHELRLDRLTQINQGLGALTHQASGPEEIQQIQEQREQEFQTKVTELEQGLGRKLDDESKDMIHQNMVDSVTEQAERDNEMFNELQREKNQLEKIDSAESLIIQSEGNIDHKTAPYKNFDSRKYDRFLIQKGELSGKEVVFKVGEIETDEQTVKTESRNLRVLEQAKIKEGQAVNVHFVKQVGEIFDDAKMIGLATEYLKDNPDIKKELSPEQKTTTIGSVIDNMQRLEVSGEAKESGLKIHDSDTISRDAIYFAQEMEKSDMLNSETVEKLQRLFQENSEALAEEELVFCHGDCHGDNIFIQKKPDGSMQESLLDFEGLRISNKYHDWCEILNKSAFLKQVASAKPDLYQKIQKNVENMWLDPSVQFNEDEIINYLTKNNDQKKVNFSLTKIYDMLSRMIAGRNNNSPLEQERLNLFSDLITKKVAKIESIKNK